MTLLIANIILYINRLHLGPLILTGLGPARNVRPLSGKTMVPIKVDQGYGSDCG